MSSLLDQYKALHCRRKPCAACELEQTGFALACQHIGSLLVMTQEEREDECEAVVELAKQEGLI